MQHDVDPLGANFRRLAVAILKQAAVDAASAKGIFAWPARKWLAFDPLAGRLLAEFEIEQVEALAWVRELPAVGPVWVGPAPENHRQMSKLVAWLNFDN